MLEPRAAWAAGVAHNPPLDRQASWHQCLPECQRVDLLLHVKQVTLEHQTRQRRLCLYILSLITSTATAIAAIAATVGRLGGGATANLHSSSYPVLSQAYSRPNMFYLLCEYYEQRMTDEW